MPFNDGFTTRALVLMQFNPPANSTRNISISMFPYKWQVSDLALTPTILGGMNMNEIIQRLIERTGLPEDKAAVAVETVVGFLKEKLPAPMASQIDSLMSGGDSGTASNLGGIGSSLGGMFGKKE